MMSLYEQVRPGFSPDGPDLGFHALLSAPKAHGGPFRKQQQKLESIGSGIAVAIDHARAQKPVAIPMAAGYMERNLLERQCALEAQGKLCWDGALIFSIAAEQHTRDVFLPWPVVQFLIGPGLSSIAVAAREAGRGDS